MEGKGNRINQEDTTLHLPFKLLENPPGMEGKCMRCGRPEHEQGENVQPGMPNAKTATRLDTSNKVCQSSKRTARANLAQITPQDMNDTHIDECGYTQPNPPAINMLKVINNTGTTSGTESLKFPIDVNPRGTYTAPPRS